MLAGALQTWVHAFAFDIQVLSDVEVLEIALFLFKRWRLLSITKQGNSLYQIDTLESRNKN